MGKPHILIFNPDQWRGDVLGHVGNQAAVTPNLDRLVAEEAVSFRSAFCQNPVCTPSRCSFMSGWYPHVAGHRTMHHMMHPHEPVLLKDLKDSGYFVWWGGKNDLIPGQTSFADYCDVKYRPPEGDRPRHLDGFGDWRGSPDGDNYYSFYHGRLPHSDGRSYFYDHDWAMVEGCLDAIKHRPTDQPLCLFLPLVYPHPIFAVEDPWYSMIDRALLPPRIPTPANWTGKPSVLEGLFKAQHLQTWSEERWRELLATYYGMCARVDHQFGLVLEALKQAGIYDDTAIFFFADHGEFAGNYGLVEKTQNTFEDCLVRAPLIIKPPKGVPSVPRVSNALVELIDVRATVEDLTGLPQWYTHFGRSLLPLLANTTDEHRDAVFCEGGRVHGERHCMELESPQDPRGLYGPRMSLQQSEGAEHGKAVMCRTHTFKYVRRLYEQDELYDLVEDAQEMNNRIHDPSLFPVLTALRERLLTFFLETGDVVPHSPDRR